MIKIEHTLFSLPFVLSAAVLAVCSLGMQNYNPLAEVSSLDDLVSTFNSAMSGKANIDFRAVFFNGLQELDPLVFLWIFLCLLGARSAGMTLNRIIDAKIDAQNPRTSDREIPQGKISYAQAWLFTVISILVLVFAAFQLPRLCQILLPIPIIWVWAYPYLKRFTWFCHFFLGTTLAGATLGGWIAITGTLESLCPVFLSLAVMFWVSGFDIIYATQDFEFDREHQVKSIPAQFGVTNALKIARFMHFLTPLFLYLAGEAMGLGLIYKLGVVVTIGALFYEQKLVKENKIEKAFFTVNSWISVVIFLFVLLDIIF